MEAIRVTDKEWEIAGVHYVRTEAMCNGFGVREVYLPTSCLICAAGM